MIIYTKLTEGCIGGCCPGKYGGGAAYNYNNYNAFVCVDTTYRFFSHSL